MGVQREHAVSDPQIMMGKPTIAGTRITVESIVESWLSERPRSRSCEAHPRLTEDAIRAALAFAAESLRADVVYPVREATA